MESTSVYQSPLSGRYASKQMKELFSSDKKFRTWRLLWIALAKAEKGLGLPITQEQIDQLEANKTDINYEVAEKTEKLLRHDVMAHIHAYGEQCPDAKGIIHLGATSCYVTDNADIIIMKEALQLIKAKVIAVISKLADFAMKYKDLPTLGFTHFQPAQLTTVGKRACLWMHDLLLDLEEIDFALETAKLLGSKGTTGTQASFKELFNGDISKVKQLDEAIAREFGFGGTYPVSGQTYSRKIDSRFMNVLSQIAQSCSKFSNDMRLLQHLKEIEEPFETKQVGSSAMPYKRNPMRSERISGLARFVIADSQNTAMTSSVQWFERTLDDSSNRRLALPEAFLCVDSILNIYLNIAEGMVVYPKVIAKHVNAELPFMATENILMDAVKKGGDRQELHERIRTHAMAAGEAVKVRGEENDLLQRIANDPAFNMSLADLQANTVQEDFVGLAPEQTVEFINTYVKPILDNNETQLNFEHTTLEV